MPSDYAERHVSRTRGAELILNPVRGDWSSIGLPLPAIVALEAALYRGGRILAIETDRRWTTVTVCCPSITGAAALEAAGVVSFLYEIPGGRPEGFGFLPL